MMIALVMMKMSPINMSIFVECIGFVSTHQIGKIDIFCPPSFDEQIYYDDSMPPFYDMLMKVVSERS